MFAFYFDQVLRGERVLIFGLPSRHLDRIVVSDREPQSFSMEKVVGSPSMSGTKFSQWLYSK